jgi:hypothetical protein
MIVSSREESKFATERLAWRIYIFSTASSFLVMTYKLFKGFATHLVPPAGPLAFTSPSASISDDGMN